MNHIKLSSLLVFCFSVNTLLYSHKYYSQFSQDKFLIEFIFKFKKGGFFFDIGAYDGITDSNSYFMEKNLNWSGICVEPLEDKYKLLKKRRNCICINGCIDLENTEKNFMHITGSAAPLSGLIEHYDKNHLNRIDSYLKELGGNKKILKVKTFKFNDICYKYNIKKIDFLSVDTEGSEEEIIKSIDFDKIDIDVIAIENNYNNQSIRDYLKSKNYRYLTRMCIDDIFKKIRKPEEASYNMFQ